MKSSHLFSSRNHVETKFQLFQPPKPRQFLNVHYIYIYIYLLRKPFTVFTDILEREALLRFQDERHSGGREEGKHSIHPPIARASSNRARKWRKCVAPFKKHRKATLSSSSSFRARNRKKEGGRRRERACRHTCTVSGGSTGLRGHLAIGHQSIV